jgi:hypothetical protein
VAGVELKPCARDRVGEQPGVLGRDRGVRVPVADQCRHPDGTGFEAPGPGEQPQVLGDSPAAAAECLEVVSQEGVAQAGLGERAAVDAG